MLSNFSQPRSDETKRRRIAVIGAGIAGVAIAELLQRDVNVAVTLFESAAVVGAGASMDQHGWFHTGNLYSLRNNEATVSAAMENIRIIQSLYSSFPVHGTANKNWLTNEAVHYIFGTPIKDESASSPNPPAELENFARDAGRIALRIAESRNELPSDVKADAITVVGSDTRMRARVILIDLLSSFLSHSGSLITSARFIKYWRSGTVLMVRMEGHATFEFDEIILAMGAATPIELLAAAGAHVRVSPMAVSSPVLSSRNIVFVDDGRTASLSHIIHSSANQRYSVISGGYDADPLDHATIEATKLALEEAIRGNFGDAFDRGTFRSYFGRKTDRISSGQNRDYSPIDVEVEPGVRVCFPGKFSFAFLLAARVSRALGIDVSLPRFPRQAIDFRMVAKPRHKLIASQILQEFKVPVLDAQSS